MFYRCSAATHFAAKPESATVLAQKFKTDVEKRKKKLKVRNYQRLFLERSQCLNCSHDLGYDLGLGPNKRSVLLFGIEKVVLRGTTRSAKDKWRDVINQYPEIEVREESNFFGAVHLPQEPIQQAVITKPPIVFPQPHHSVFDFRKILVSEKIPKPEQTQAFVEGLLRDLIVVLPTGCGKSGSYDNFSLSREDFNCEHDTCSL